MLLELCDGQNNGKGQVQSHKWIYNSEASLLQASHAEASLVILFQFVVALYHPKADINAFGATQRDILFLFQSINKGTGSIN